MSPPLFLQAPAPPTRQELIGRFFETFWPLLVPVVLGLIGVYLLLPRARRYPPLWGGVAAGLALATGAWILIRTETALPETILFWSFSGLAVISGGLLITLTNPVHAALSFALVVLSTCGLFLLQAAPFLMAATIIIYAGAIIVTFLFVIMLAQQEGPSNADQRSREPFLTTVAGFILLGALLCVLYRTYDTTTLDDLLERAERASKATTAAEIETALGGYENYKHRFLKLLAPRQEERREGEPLEDVKGRVGVERAMLRRAVDEAFVRFPGPGDSKQGKITDQDLADLKAELKGISERGRRVRLAQGVLLAQVDLPASPFSGTRPNADLPITPDGKVIERMPANNVSALGRSLFSDYLLAVELAGVLLLVATIGAAAIAGRRAEGLR